MRKLVYVCEKENATVKTVSLAQADDLRAGGWNVKSVLETIPEPLYVAPKQMAGRKEI